MLTFSRLICACGVIALSMAAWGLAEGQSQPPAVNPCSDAAILTLPPANQANQRTICGAAEQLEKAKKDLDTAISNAKTAQDLNNQAVSNAGDANTKAAVANTTVSNAATNTASTQKQVAKDLARAEVLLPKSAVLGNAKPPLVGDHVPCLMDRDELYALRGIGTDDKDVQNAVLQATHKACDPTNPNCQEYSTQVSLMSFRGLTNAQRSAQLSKAASDANVSPQVAAAGAAAATEAAEQTFQRPTNIGCSMSVMPWEEASKIFGRAVANTFLAVQVDVRNLDNNHEFLLHDAELAVDAYSLAIQRFQVGHEKEVVRGVSVWGQSYGRHAIALHIVEGVGILMGAVVGLPSPLNTNLVNASGAYQAGFVPTFNKIFPSLDTNNLNNLNDLAFSARSNSRIVVPKGGSVPFVMFVPVEPLQEACWLQKGYNFLADESFTTACTAFCTDSNQPPCKPPQETINHWKQVGFKHWTPIQLQALQKHAYATIAGQHFQAVATAATLNTITCTSAAKSGAYYQALIGGDLTCTLTGSGFDTMNKLRLRPPGDTKDTNAIDGTVTLNNGDTTTATAKIVTADVKRINQPTYNLFSVDKSGIETDLKNTLSFLLSPTVTAGQKILLNDLTASKATLAGANLQQVTKVILKSATNEIDADAIKTDPAGTKITLAVTSANPKADSYNLTFVLSDDKGSSYETKQTVVVQ